MTSEKKEITKEKWTEIYDYVCYKLKRGERVELPYALVPVGKDNKYYMVENTRRE